MPRPVVPILRSPRAASRARSSAPCSGRISAALSAMRSMSGVTRRPCARDLVDLGQQRLGVDHDAVADDAELAAHQARRQQRELVGLVADHQRVAGVVAALEAHHDVGAAGEPVHHLAFALVAPLGADHGDVRPLQSPVVVSCRLSADRSVRRRRLQDMRAAEAACLGRGIVRRRQPGDGGVALARAARGVVLVGAQRHIHARPRLARRGGAQDGVRDKASGRSPARRRRTR